MKSNFSNQEATIESKWSDFPKSGVLMCTALDLLGICVRVVFSVCIVCDRSNIKRHLKWIWYDLRFIGLSSIDWKFGRIFAYDAYHYRADSVFPRIQLWKTNLTFRRTRWATTTRNIANSGILHAGKCDRRFTRLWWNPNEWKDWILLGMCTENSDELGYRDGSPRFRKMCVVWKREKMLVSERFIIDLDCSSEMDVSQSFWISLHSIPDSISKCFRLGLFHSVCVCVCCFLYSFTLKYHDQSRAWESALAASLLLKRAVGNGRLILFTNPNSIQQCFPLSWNTHRSGLCTMLGVSPVCSLCPIALYHFSAPSKW